MLNRALSIFVCVVILFLSICLECSGADIYITAQSAVVMIAETGQVVYSKNMDEKRGIASTTKIMSSIIALESGKLDNVVTAKSQDVNVEGTSLGLKAGDKITLLNLVKGMLHSSGNDSANVTAAFLAGNNDGFAELMNKKAAEIGMKSTSFKNPSGLTQDGHYSTAYDMALLGCYAIKNITFCEICSSQSCKVSFGNPIDEKTLFNHNRFLNMYKGAFGIKTGFTKASGRCLVTAVKGDNATLVAVTLNAPDDWNDHKKMYDYAFSLIEFHKPEIKIPVVNTVGGVKNWVSANISKEIIIPYAFEIPHYSRDFYIPHFMYCPVSSGDYVGFVELQFFSFFKNRYYIVSSENNYYKK